MRIFFALESFLVWYLWMPFQFHLLDPLVQRHKFTLCYVLWNSNLLGSDSFAPLVFTSLSSRSITIFTAMVFCFVFLILYYVTFVYLFYNIVFVLNGLNPVTFLLFYHLIFELTFFWVHVSFTWFIIQSTSEKFCFVLWTMFFLKSGGFIILLHAMFLSFKGWLLFFVFICEPCLNMFRYLSLFSPPVSFTTFCFDLA